MRTSPPPVRCRRVLFACALVLCLASLIALPARATTAAAASTSVPGRDELVAQLLKVGDEWFGLYVLGQKAGSMFTSAKISERDGRPVLVTSQLTVLNASVGKNKVMRQVRGERVYELTGEGRLVFFREERVGDGGDESFIGHCAPQGVRLVRQAKGQAPQEMTLAATRENIDDALAALRVLRTGQPHEGSAFDLSHLMADKRVTTSLASRRNQTIDGVETVLTELSLVEADSRVAQSALMTPEGRTIEIRYGNVLTAKSEPREVAERQGHVDVFGTTRIVLGGTATPDQKLSADARRAPSRVVYEIDGLPKDYWTSNGWQRFSPVASDNPGRVTLAVTAMAPQKALTLPLAPAQIAAHHLDEWLRPTLAVESQAPDIVALTQKTLGQTTDAFEAVEKLTRFVYRFLKKSYGVSSDRATRVLALKEGDCTEHALLFTAMARAAGIPARRINGLVYMDSDDGVPSLYWHEWVEVFVGEWVPVDPTFDQSVADTGHLAFGVEGQNDVAALFGQLRIKVLKVEKPTSKPLPIP